MITTVATSQLRESIEHRPYITSPYDARTKPLPWVEFFVADISRKIDIGDNVSINPIVKIRKYDSGENGLVYGFMDDHKRYNRNDILIAINTRLSKMR